MWSWFWDLDSIDGLRLVIWIPAEFQSPVCLCFSICLGMLICILRQICLLEKKLLSCCSSFFVILLNCCLRLRDELLIALAVTWEGRSIDCCLALLHRLLEGNSFLILACSRQYTDKVILRVCFGFRLHWFSPCWLAWMSCRSIDSARVCLGDSSWNSSFILPGILFSSIWLQKACR